MKAEITEHLHPRHAQRILAELQRGGPHRNLDVDLADYAFEIDSPAEVETIGIVISGTQNYVNLYCSRIDGQSVNSEELDELWDFVFTLYDRVSREIPVKSKERQAALSSECND